MPINADRARRMSARRRSHGPSISEQAYQLLNPAYVLTPTGAANPASESEALGLPPFGRGVELLAAAVATTSWYAAKWQPGAGVWQRLADQPRMPASVVPA